MPKVLFKERVWKEREQVILAEAGKLMREYGFEKLNMDKVAEAVGIAKPTLYQHFRSKDDLIAQVLINGMAMLEQHLDEMASESPRAQIEQIYHMLLTEKFSPEGILASLDSVQIINLVRSNPAIRAAKNQVNERLRQLIEEGKAQGEINRETPTDFIVCYLFHTLSILDVMYPDKNAPEWSAFVNGKFEFMLKAFQRVISP
jgi:AcrR family transcriptional regulator